MRFWLLAFTLALLLSCVSQAQQPFPGNAPVTFTFRETLKDKVVQEPGTLPADQSFLVGTERTLTIQGTAPLTGFDLTQLDDFSPYNIVVGDFDSSQISGLQGRLSDDENYASDTSRSVIVPITELNYDGDEVPVGQISLNWNTTRVLFLVQIDNVGQALTEIEYGVATDFYRETSGTIDAEDLTAAFSFGPFAYNLRTIYTVGAASFESDPNVSDLISTVSLDGAIDYIPPVVAITEPVGGSTTASNTVTIFGTASDKREIKKTNSTLTFDGVVETVEVQVGTSLSPGTFQPAALLDPTHWQLENAPLAAGENLIVVRVTDEHGNVTTSPSRKITYLTKGSMEFTAQATGFPVGATGVAGTVKAGWFTNPGKQLAAHIGSSGESTSVTKVDAGQRYTVVAKPAAGAVFNGWTATLDGAPYFTSVDEKLTFETKPNLKLKAEFVPNPFDPIFGIYHGRVTGDNASERGTFKIAIGKTGAFSGKLTAGAVALTLKGKVLGSGRWEGKVKSKAGEFTVAFQMNVSGTGNRDLTGTVTGNGITADIAADLNNWRKPRKTDPGNLATEYAGSYNVLLSQFFTSDPTPGGVGYARVTINTVGKVTVVGKLGDGTAFSTGATLVKKVGGVFFPFFCPLDKGLGNISGAVAYSAEPESDLTATLDWNEPATTKVEPQPFTGQISLTGARYAAPTTGGFAILGNGANGIGKVDVKLPAYTVPTTPPGAASPLTSTATLNPTTQVVAVDASLLQTQAFKMKIAPKTGLFSGSFKDLQLNKTIPFTGMLTQKTNGGLGLGGGVFIRGNKAGAVSFGPQ